MTTSAEQEQESGLGWFDRFAGRASGIVSRAPFFVACVLLVLVWAPSLPLFGSIDTWQLVINTITTIVTFLLVALLQNSGARGQKSTEIKLNAIAEGLADLMTHVAEGGDPEGLRADVDELRRAVGIEEQVSA